MANEVPPNQTAPTGQKWKDCDVCGLKWPEKDLSPQRGYLACPGCVDDPGVKDNQGVLK